MITDLNSLTIMDHQGEVELVAQGAITLRVGKAKIRLEENGTISFEGTSVNYIAEKFRFVSNENSA